MRVLVIGRADDARGFALAGAATRRAGSPAEVEQALAAALGASPPWGLVVVAAPLGAEAAHLVAEAQARPGPPALVVIPEGGEHGHPR